MCVLLYSINLLMEIAAAYLSEGGKYVDIFSALKRGILSIFLTDLSLSSMLCPGTCNM